MILAKRREALPQLRVHLLARRGQHLIHRIDTPVEVGKIGEALLLIEQLGGKKRRDTRGHLARGDVGSPRIHPARPRTLRDLGLRAVGERDDLGTALASEMARIEHLWRVAAMAARDHEAVLAQALRRGDAELARRVGPRNDAPRLALEQHMSRQQIDERAAAGDPIHLLNRSALLDDVLDEIERLHDVPFHMPRRPLMPRRRAPPRQSRCPPSRRARSPPPR